MRIARQLGVVLKTYLTRVAFGVIVLMGLASLVATYAIGRWGYHVEFGLAVFLAANAIYSLPFTMGIALIVMFFVHVRQQLRGPLAALTPDFRVAHLTVAGTIFFGIIVAATFIYCDRNAHWTPWNYYSLSFFGVFLVMWTLMSLAALAAIESPWWLLWLIPLVIAIASSKGSNYFLNLFTQDWGVYRQGVTWRMAAVPWVFTHERQAAWISDIARLAHRVWAARTVILLLNVGAMVLVVRRARPQTGTLWGWKVIQKVQRLLSLQGILGGDAAAIVEHRPLGTILRRAWHRRLAVHSPYMAWAIAASIAALSVLIKLLIGSDPTHLTVVTQSLVLATIVPGVSVAAGWCERWPSIGYESLLPSGRVEFAREIAIGMGLDLAQFWIAGWLGAMVPLLIWEPHVFLSGQFLASVAASALMQFLAFGGTLLGARRRIGIIYPMLLLGFLLAVMIPILDAWSHDPAFRPAGLIGMASLEMLVGLVLAVVGHAAWRRGNLA